MVSKPLLEQIRKLRPEVSRGGASDNRDFTGERFLPGYADGSIELEHFHRYSFALPFVLGRRVLDIACGEGYGCDLMGHVAGQVTGVDIDAQVIEAARNRYPRANVQFKAGSADNIPLDSNTVDVVVSFETLEHLADHASFWPEIRRVLKPGGLLIISSPDREVYNQQRKDKNSFHEKELTRQELTAELSRTFKHHQLFSQAVVFGSLITPVDLPLTALTMISVAPDTGVVTWKTPEDVQHPYTIALASDEALLIPGQSLYSGDYPPNAMASLAGGVAERDQLVRELKEQLRERDKHPFTLLGARRGQNGMVRENGSHQLANGQQELLIRQRDLAVLQAGRMKETLAEQDKIIEALRTLMDECTRSAAAAELDRSRQSHSGNIP